MWDRDLGTHGTRVAGIAAGVKFGIAKDATVHPIISNGDIGLDQFDGPALLQRLDWVKTQVAAGAKPAVLNMSFNISTVGLAPGSIEDNNRLALTAKVNELIGLGVVVVVSAGNHNGSPLNYWPSQIPAAIVVGGVDDYGRRWIRDERPDCAPARRKASKATAAPTMARSTSGHRRGAFGPRSSPSSTPHRSSAPARRTRLRS